MKRIPILAVLLSAFGILHSSFSVPPNIIVILADDLGWSDLGCYGGEIPTPNIDSLAAGGLRFTQFYNNAVCGPSRASLLTGLYAQRIGHSGAHWNQPTDFTRSITLGEGLQRAGYHTMMVGKWQDPESLSPRDHPAWRVPQNCVLRAGNWKIISKDESTPRELDDLAADGTETTNLAGQHPDVVKQLAAKWEAWAEPCRASK